MGVAYTVSKSRPKGGAAYFKMAAQVPELLQEELNDAGEAGLAYAKNIIMTSGTNRDWESPGFRNHEGERQQGSGEGRIDSGEMLNALSFKITGGRTVGLQVGWLGIWMRYFEAQDEGFDAPGFRALNQHVEGMHMIASLRTYMNGKVDAALDRVQERILNGL